MKKILAILVFIGALPLMAEGPRYEVTITNLTKGQVFTPILVASHRQGVKLFSPGEGASVELEMLAEGGSTGALMSKLAANPRVLDVADSGGVIPPGMSGTAVVRAHGRYRYFSIAGMLVPTNDAIVSANGLEGPRLWEASAMYLAPAWDAGTEANDEDCDSIPGPPGVCGGEGFNASREGAEGFVHIHSGIYGGADLDGRERDWRNPVARIVIRRVR